MNLEQIKAEFTQSAQTASKAFADKHFDGEDGGACGFAWVTVYTQYKGNTKLGKAERQILKSMGFRVDYTGKGFEIWDPAKWPGQSIDVKEAGACAAAEVLKKYGFNAYAGSRLD